MTVLSDVSLPQISVLGSTMAYREAGDREAPVAFFLHGNPTSSYVWRNVLPLVALVAHCIAIPVRTGLVSVSALSALRLGDEDQYRALQIQEVEKRRGTAMLQ